MQHQGGPDLCAQMFGIGSNRAECFGSDLKQETIDHCLVSVSDGADRRRQGEYHMVILDRQQIGLPGFEPTLGGAGLALGAMPVTARVVGDFVMIASRAAQDNGLMVCVEEVMILLLSGNKADCLLSKIGKSSALSTSHRR